MAEPKAFSRAKLVCGIIAGKDPVFRMAEERLSTVYGPADAKSSFFAFDVTNYYEKQMGTDLKRRFISFKRLINPEKLSSIKLATNRLEGDIRDELRAGHRIANIDPGYVIPSALIMATAKNFSHRVPLLHGIYAHLEFLFGRDEIRPLPWTYPDYKNKGYQDFFLEVRRIYLSQLKKKPAS